MNKTLLLVAGGILAYALLRPRAPQQTYVPGVTQVPQAPNPYTQAAAFQAWASTILNTFGNVVELWQPGGPFYGREDQLEAVADQINTYGIILP